MAELQILNPNDQPLGRLRLISELSHCLSSDDYTSFMMAVAFVKVGPLIRLESRIEAWLSKGKAIEAVWGINHKGTSQQALTFALNYFKAHILFAGDYLTFHPKMYLFFGPKKCRFFIGSHNLTVGGTETNWEGGLKLDLSLPADKSTADNVLAIWKSLRTRAVELTKANFPALLASGLLLDESKAPPPASQASASAGTGPHKASAPFKFPRFAAKPPSPLPASAFAPKKAKAPSGSPRSGKIQAKKPRVRPTPKALVIQVVPHANGEVFLSKIALNQNPAFFGFPFKGRTKPKFASNQSYPQRIPDPIVNLTVYGRSGKPVTTVSHFPLNTVFYERKADIRITVPSSVISTTPPYSVLVMRQPTTTAGRDYDLEFYAPGSNQFKNYLSVCNQTLPSGGKKTPRRMGWL